MHQLLLLLTLCNFILFCGSSKASDTGGMGSSGGGELPSFEHNPWFLGTDSVKYCVDRSDRFSRSLHAVEEDIRGALSNWARTIKSREQYPYILTKADGSKISQSISTEYSQVPCNENPDLTFHIGTYPSQVENQWQQGFLGNLAAFAKQISFDRNLGRAKGYIWVVPDLGNDTHSYRGPIIGPSDNFWAGNNYAFWNVIMHEIGHVFGFPHDDVIKGSLMNSDTPANSIRNARVLQQSEIPKYSSETLVAHNWLGASRMTCGQAMLMRLAPASTGEMPQTNDKFLLELFGIPASRNGLVDVCVKSKLSDMGRKMHFDINVEQGPLIGFDVKSDFDAFNDFLGVKGYYGTQAVWPHVFYPMWHKVDLEGELQNTNHLSFSLRDVGSIGFYKLQIISSDGKPHEATLKLESVTGW